MLLILQQLYMLRYRRESMVVPVSYLVLLRDNAFAGGNCLEVSLCYLIYTQFGSLR